MAVVNGLVQSNFNAFLACHEQQLRSCGIPGHLWKKLHEKLWSELYDAHHYVVLNRIEYDDDDDDSTEHGNQFEWQMTVTCPELAKSDPNSIFLVDHAWTFDPGSIRESLLKVPGLKERMAALMDLEGSDNPNELVDAVCGSVWKFCRHYKMSQSAHLDQLRHNPELQQLRWYVLDEVGSRIGHSDQPTARMVPFFFAPRGICYSVFWPIKDLLKDEVVTVDYVEHIKDANLRPYYLLPWRPEDHSTESVAHSYTFTVEFFNSHRVQETIPDPDCVPARLSTDSPIKVYSDLALVRSHLTDSRFTLTEDADEANILWLFDHFKDFAKLSVSSPVQFVNQFPGEQVLTVKDLLAAVASMHAPDRDKDMSSSDSPMDLDPHLTTDWYPVTFNLVYELPQFVAYFQRKQSCIEAASGVNDPSSGESSVHCAPGCPRHMFYNKQTCELKTLGLQLHNIWILKPWNAGRGLGITITDNLNQIIRLCDTNPLIASRYVTDPVLFYREDLQACVKFDVRYVVLLHSVHPLRLFVYNVFWLRFANQPFSLTDFDHYDKHFTVMNYREEQALKQIHCDEFVRQFDEQYPDVTWSTVQNDVFRVITEMFTEACASPCPRGISASSQSRAMYAVDLMLEWHTERTNDHVCHRVRPVVCEVNYSPDCQRACQYHPDFFNHVFGCLFLDDPADRCNVTQLL